MRAALLFHWFIQIKKTSWSCDPWTSLKDSHFVDMKVTYQHASQLRWSQYNNAFQHQDINCRALDGSEALCSEMCLLGSHCCCFALSALDEQHSCAIRLVISWIALLCFLDMTVFVAGSVLSQNCPESWLPSLTSSTAIRLPWSVSCIVLAMRTVLH